MDLNSIPLNMEEVDIKEELLDFSEQYFGKEESEEQLVMEASTEIKFFLDNEAEILVAENIKIEEIDQNALIKSEFTESEKESILEEEIFNNGVIKFENLMMEEKSSIQHKFVSLKNVSLLLKKIKEKGSKVHFESDEEKFFAELLTSKFPFLNIKKLTDEEIESLIRNSDDFDYAPSTSTEESVSSQKCSNILKSNSTINSENAANSQNYTDSEIKKITVQNLNDCNYKSKINYCPYCVTLQTHLPRHMINKHKTEKKVQEFMSYPTSTKERTVILEELRKLGNFRHNSFVINNCKGEILPTVRPKNEAKAKNYVSCKNCLGFFPKSLLWRHNARCKIIHKPNLQSNGHAPSVLTEFSISPQKCTTADDFDYAPSTSTEESISPQKCSNILKSNSAVNSENAANSQNYTDSEIKKITVQTVIDCNYKSRKNYCPYCVKQKTHLPRHMINKHKTEKKVQEFMSYPTNTKERTVILEELRKLGNFRHNSYVINNCKGELLPTIRPKSETKAENYVPCRNCLGFFPKSVLWRHNAYCKTIHKPNLQSKRIVGHGMNLLLNAKSCSKDFIDKVVGPMNADDINLVVRNDILILKLGESMFMKNLEPSKYRYPRNAMREVARLLISLRKTDKSISSLRDAIHPIKFENVVLAAKDVAGFDGTSSFERGSLVLKIGINLKKCAEILYGMSLDEGNEELTIACEHFMKRYDQEWANISSLALRDISHKKINKPKCLPLVEDRVGNKKPT